MLRIVFIIIVRSLLRRANLNVCMFNLEEVKYCNCSEIDETKNELEDF